MTPLPKITPYHYAKKSAFVIYLRIVFYVTVEIKKPKNYYFLYKKAIID